MDFDHGSSKSIFLQVQTGCGCEIGLQLLKDKGAELVEEMEQELEEDEFEELRMMRDSCDVSDEEITDQEDSDDE